MDQKKQSVPLGDLLDRLNANIGMLEDLLRKRFIRTGAALYLEEEPRSDDKEPLELGWVRLRDYIGFGVRGGPLGSYWMGLASASPDVRVLAIEKMEDFIRILEQENGRELAEVREANGKLLELIDKESKKAP